MYANYPQQYSQLDWYLLLYSTVRARELRTPQTGKSKLGENPENLYKCSAKNDRHTVHYARDN
jgi:hypothetical protein